MSKILEMYITLLQEKNIMIHRNSGGAARTRQDRFTRFAMTVIEYDEIPSGCDECWFMGMITRSCLLHDDKDRRGKCKVVDFLKYIIEVL